MVSKNYSAFCVSMVDLATTRNCCGCSACVAACKHAAISMIPDVDGCLLPNIDNGRCVKCGACQRVCPSINMGDTNIPQEEFFAARTKDAERLSQSPSGAIFTTIASHYLKQGGIVFGCELKRPHLEVEQTKITSLLELDRLRGTKYVQSAVGDTYLSCRDELLKGSKVLYCGTPCQIAGLLRFLGDLRDNLLTIELICMGVPCPNVFNRYTQWRSRSNNSTVSNVRFRQKLPSWRESSMVVEYVNGYCQIIKNSLDPYMQVFGANLCLRESCYYCRFKRGRSGADLTIGDFWGITDKYPEYNDDLGVSSIISHTAKAKLALAAVSNSLSILNVNADETIGRNVYYDKSVPIPALRKRYMEGYISHDFDRWARCCVEGRFYKRFFNYFRRRIKWATKRLIKSFRRKQG